MSRSGSHESDMDTTIHQINARIRSTQGVINAASGLITSLTLLREDMRAAGARTVGELSEELRARHREPIRATAGTTGGVEMW